LCNTTEKKDDDGNGILRIPTGNLYYNYWLKSSLLQVVVAAVSKLLNPKNVWNLNRKVRRTPFVGILSIHSHILFRSLQNAMHWAGCWWKESFSWSKCIVMTRSEEGRKEVKEKTIDL
jgi:hypothetical protein